MIRYTPKNAHSKTLFNSLGLIGAFLLLMVIIYLGFFSQPDEFKEGNIIVDCFTKDVEILTGPDAIPHINAENLTDLYRAVGYLQASRQLSRLDRLLRVSTGQMAAAYGKKFFDMDIASHQLGFLYRAKQILAQLTPETRALFAAYCEGLNAFIATQRHSVAQRFRLAGYQPLKWEPAGCIAILNLYRWAYSSCWDEKIVLYKIGEVFGRERTADGFPLIDQWLETGTEYQDAFFARLNQLYCDGHSLRQAINLFPGRDEMLTWTVAGEKIPTGQARLFFESNWFNPAEFIFDMSAPDWRQSGLFLPGTPICLAGGNRQIAWGVNWPTDQAVDFFAVRLFPSRKKYLTPDGEQNLRKRPVQIAVRNQHDRLATFYYTDQGVILDYPSKIVDSTVNAIVLKWSGLSADEINHRIAIMLAQNWDELAELIQPAGSSLKGLVYIGEERRYGSVPGAPDLPLNPALGCLTTFRMSDMFLERKFVNEFSSGFVYPDHENGQSGKASSYSEIASADFTLLKADKYFGKILKDIYAAINDTIFTRESELLAYQALINLDGRYADASTGATVYRAFLDALIKNIYTDELNLVDPVTFQQFAADYDFSMRNLTLLLEKGESSWFDNLSTPEIMEWQGEIIRQSFREAVRFLEGRYSPNLSEWQWGRVDQDFQLGSVPRGKKQLFQDNFKSRSPGAVQAVVMSAAGQESKIIFTTINSEKPATWGTNLFSDRSELLRNSARILTLKASPEKSPE